MNNLAQQLEALFKKWEQQDHHKGRKFIRDGVFDADLWQNAPRKVAFVLKEARSTSEAHPLTDICHHVRHKRGGPWNDTWWTIANWAYAAQNVTCGSLPELPKEKEPRRTALYSCAIVEVKKSDGKKESKRDEIKYYAEKDRDLLRRQIDLLGPAIIICGGTWYALEDAHLWKIDELESLADCKIHRAGSRFFIDIWHPAKRFSKGEKKKKINYETLSQLIQHIACSPHFTS